jgi:hypothetical protein
LKRCAVTSSVEAACRITGKPALACFNEFLRLFVTDTLGNAFAATKLCNSFLTPQSVQHNTDLFLCLILFANCLENAF